MDVKEEILQVFESIGELKYKLNTIVADKCFPDDRFEAQFHRVSHWDCNESPIGLCLYHNIEDPAHDSCIYCGEPEERK
jgi:hypothetical protein